MKKLLFCLLVVSCMAAHAQETPKMFEPNLVSDGGVFGLTISPNSKTALWVKSNGKRDTLYILESNKIDGKWQKPTVAPFSTKNGAWKDIDPMFSPDGKTVLYQSTRPVEGKPDRKGFDIWAVRKNKDGWSEPYNLGNVINSDDSESYASITQNGNIYFMKENPNGIGKSDIYVSNLVDGVYQTPENIGSPINTPERESNPYISPDEDYLLYFSTDSKGFGEVDLYISFKKDGNWTSPQNLGKPINTEVAEFCPFYHLKEKRLYFSRQTKATNRFIENIYSIPFNLKDLKK